jgi:hypothetical protein
MARASEGRLLELLPERIGAYRNALAANDLDSEERCRIDLCSVIECLVEVHVDGRKGCEAISMVDGVLPATLDISDSARISIVGLVVWEGRGGWFLDPVATEIELSEDGKSVRKYSLKLGDADSGLGKYPYKPYSKDLYRSPPTDWCVVFVSGAY